MTIEYRGRKLVPRISAYHELFGLGLGLEDILEVLDTGFDCAIGKRKDGVLERCLRRGDKVLRVVVAEGIAGYPSGEKEEIYYIIHVSEESWKKGRWQ
jgi:hypothetical protein